MTSMPLNYFSMPINYLRGRRIHALMFVMGALSVMMFNGLLSAVLSINFWYRHDKVAIIILGGGLTEQGKIYEHVELRVRRAYSLYKKIKMGGAAGIDVTLIPLSGGTPHKPPPLDDAGFPITEAAGSAKRLLEMNVPASDIMEEGYSLDTLGNAYFLRNTHIDPGRYNKMIVITNDWHMPRTKAYFEAVFSLPSAASPIKNPNSWLHQHSHPDLQIEYEEVGPALQGDVLRARMDREQKSLQMFLEQTKREFSNMEELHSFLFTKHKAYQSSRLLEPHAKLDASVSKTY